MLKAATIIDGRAEREHEAYLSLWKMPEKEDDLISLMFDDLRRNNAIHKLAEWHRFYLISQCGIEPCGTASLGR